VQEKDTKWKKYTKCKTIIDKMSNKNFVQIKLANNKEKCSHLRTDNDRKGSDQMLKDAIKTRNKSVCQRT